MSNASTIRPLDHVEVAICYFRACGPATVVQLANEIRIQVPSVNAGNAMHLASLAIDHGLNRGWLAAYDEESYDMA